VEAVFGLHNWPGYPQGSLACSAGPVMASANTFQLVVRGAGGHAALPHLAADPMPVACQVVQAWQTIISRNKRPLDTAVLSVTMMHGGEVGNVIPDRCTLEGTVRTYRDEVPDLVERRMRDIARHTCAAFGMRCDFEFLRRAPAVVNHAHEAAVAARVAARVCAPGPGDGAGTGHAVGGLCLHAAGQGPAPTPSSATATACTANMATAKGPACCTTPATTSTTRCCRWAPRTGSSWCANGWASRDPDRDRRPDMSIRIVRLGSPRAPDEGLRIGTLRRRSALPPLHPARAAGRAGRRPAGVTAVTPGRGRPP
jgi:amidohydrolase